MTKVIVFITKAVIATIITFLFTSCDFAGNFKTVDGTGNVTTKQRTISGEFRSVSASEGLEVVIEQGSGRMVTVEADDNLHQHIKTEVEDGQLKIHSDVNIGNASAKRVIVRMQNIEGIEAASSASVTSRNTIKGTNVDISSSSGGSIDVTVEAKDVSCEASSGSSLKVSGRAENVSAEASSGSSLNAKGLIAKTVSADASSGGSLNVNPEESLTAQASSGGHVYYVKTPGNLVKDSSSGGEVSQE